MFEFLQILGPARRIAFGPMVARVMPPAPLRTAVALTALALGGCGQKGPLYLPAPTATPAAPLSALTPATAQVQPAPSAP